MSRSLKKMPYVEERLKQRVEKMLSKLGAVVQQFTQNLLVIQSPFTMVESISLFIAQQIWLATN